MPLASLLTHATRLDTMSTGNSTAALVSTVISIAIAIFYIAATWQVYAKAGKPGWAAIIPIYNTIVLLQIAGRPVWWFLLLLIPLVNIVFLIIVLNDLSKSFGHGVGFTLGLIFLGFIFLPVLAFGGSKYVGPAAA
ncbi:MAG: hypothetical protein PVSMB4_16340 [Ktedonobacterales bacterium]